MSRWQSDSSWPHGRTGVNPFTHTEVTLWPGGMFRWQADCLPRPQTVTFPLQKGFRKDFCAVLNYIQLCMIDIRCYQYTSESGKSFYFAIMLILLINKHVYFMYKLASGSCRAAEADHLPPVTILSPPRHVTFMLEGPGLLILQITCFHLNPPFWWLCSAFSPTPAVLWASPWLQNINSRLLCLGGRPQFGD